MFISTKGKGDCAAFPDVCKTPSPAGPVPIPYPNMGQLAQADAGTCSAKVKILNKPVVTLKTEIPMSSGDEAGSAGGVMSGKNKGPIKFLKGSLKVTVEGTPVVFLTCMSGQNGSNANAPAGAQISPSQEKVMVMG